MEGAREGGEEVKPSPAVGPGLPQHPVNAGDRHRGVDAEVFAASAGVGDMVVAELQHQPRPAASNTFDTPAPHHLEIPDPVDLRHLEGRPGHPAGQSGVRRPRPVSQEVVPAADADNAAENGGIGPMVQVGRPLAVQFEPVRDEPAHLRIEAEVLNVAGRLTVAGPSVQP